eukprot:CFRG0275T1
MSWEALLFVLAVLLAAALLFVMVYFIIQFSDLEVDYINPIDLCSQLNKHLVPEYIAHGILTLLFLLSFQWTSFAINLPLSAYNGWRFVCGTYQLDPTVIFRDLDKLKRECFIKLAFYLLSFFFYLYRMILALVSSD